MHTLSCLGAHFKLSWWLSCFFKPYFGPEPEDVWHSLLFLSFHLLLLYLRCGDIWWLLKSFAYWITFLNAFFSLEYLLLLEQPDCDTCVHYRKQCGPVEWIDSWDGRSATGPLVLFWTGFLSVFFPCKIRFLERLKKFQDVLGAHSKNLCLVIYQLAGGLAVPVDFIVLFSFSLPKQSQGILFCF